jgi:hypothetical protein
MVGFQENAGGRRAFAGTLFGVTDVTTGLTFSALLADAISSRD